MQFRKLILAWMLCLMGLLAVGDGMPKRRKFPAIYNFGDSNSDTGGRSASLRFVPPPNGETFFRAPSGRICDGRLIIDFIAEKLHLPYLNAYLDSIGTSFRHGANFAISGSTILPIPGGFSPFHLEIQTGQFLQFQNRTSALYDKLSQERDEVALLLINSSLPKPREFSKSLYTFDIGQNDLNIGIKYSSEAQTQASIPTILHRFAETIYTLYSVGARNFWIHNTGPLGCLPHNVIHSQPIKSDNLDKNGCIISHNKIAQEFNKQLKHRVFLFREKLKAATFTYVDIYSAKYSLISSAKTLGFKNPSAFCCGSYYGNPITTIPCGDTAIVNGTVRGNPCTNPMRYISWDSIHYTEAANLLVAKTILKDSLSEVIRST